MALAGADKTAMPEDDSSTLHAPEIPDKRRSWLDRISSMLSGEPSTRDDLVELLRDVQADGLIAADTLKMMEGALTVSALSVGAVMVPRSQMVMIAAAEKLIDLMKHIVESGHSRRPCHGDAKAASSGRLLPK